MLVKQKIKHIVQRNEGQAKTDYRAFWQNESIGRPLFYATATDENSFKPYQNKHSITRKEMDLDVVWQALYDIGRL